MSPVEDLEGFSLTKGRKESIQFAIVRRGDLVRTKRESAPSRQELGPAARLEAARTVASRESVSPQRQPELIRARLPANPQPISESNPRRLDAESLT